MDYYDLSMKLIKAIASKICDLLTIIFNNSFSKGIFPDCLKVLKIVPIFKAGDPRDPGNYRLISLIVQFAKILEKLFQNRLQKFLEKNNVFYVNHNTGFAVAHLADTVCKSLENKDSLIATFIDLIKAFDTVNHEILLQKLLYYGVHGVAWECLASYLD